MPPAPRLSARRVGNVGSPAHLSLDLTILSSSSVPDPNRYSMGRSLTEKCDASGSPRRRTVWELDFRPAGNFRGVLGAIPRVPLGSSGEPCVDIASPSSSPGVPAADPSDASEPSAANASSPSGNSAASAACSRMNSSSSAESSCLWVSTTASESLSRTSRPSNASTEYFLLAVRVRPDRRTGVALSISSWSPRHFKGRRWTEPRFD